MRVPRWLGAPSEAQIENAFELLREGMSQYFDLSPEEWEQLVGEIDGVIIEFLSARAECHSEEP